MLERLKHNSGKDFVTGKQRTHTEVIEFLDARWGGTQCNEKTLEHMKALDKASGNPSQKLHTIFVAGTNGKSLSAYFTAQLLKAEGLKVGLFYAPHVLTYNERFVINGEAIASKNFTELANEIINADESLNLKAHTQELLTMIALLHFVRQEVDAAILEVHQGGRYNPVNICTAKVATITRITPQAARTDEAGLKAYAEDIMGIVKKDTHVISGDQNKSHLVMMQQLTEAVGGRWAMPIRKLAPLGYPYEQIHGRCAALAERTAQIFAEKILIRATTVIAESLLVKTKGQRGRPTLEEKRASELNPKKTIEQFWKETAVTDLPYRFQLLEKEKPSVLLDNAHNLDAFKNLLLGIRLLHYQRPFKGLAIVMAAAQETFDSEEFLRAIRYFFKKTSGQLFLCPLTSLLPGTETDTWDAENVVNDLKTMKVKARACASFDEAFEAAKKSVDERNGLLVVTGSQSIINQYWKSKGIKKL